MTQLPRDYDNVLRLIPRGLPRDAAMQAVVDVVWQTLHLTGISWIGFYLDAGNEQLVLGPRRDKPACSPIGLHGACGRCFLSKLPLIVRDVGELGENYIACDPRDRSEVVLPCVDLNGACWGVLDADSHDLASFDESDVVELTELLRAAGLTK